MKKDELAIPLDKSPDRVWPVTPRLQSKPQSVQKPRPLCGHPARSRIALANVRSGFTYHGRCQQESNELDNFGAVFGVVVRQRDLDRITIVRSTGAYVNGKHELLEVLRDARLHLARPDNDFGFSPWAHAAAALADIDRYITAIETEQLSSPFDLSLLFAPTGAIQEVSLSSGWGDEFLVLADRFDAAAARVWAASEFWRDIGGQELDAVERAMREESEGLGENLA